MGGLYAPPKRSPRGPYGTGPKRIPFHIKFTEVEFRRLTKLSKKLKMTGADVIRWLLENA